MVFGSPDEQIRVLSVRLSQAQVKIKTLETDLRTAGIRHVQILKNQKVDLVKGFLDGSVDPFDVLMKEGVLEQAPPLCVEVHPADAYIVSESLTLDNPFYLGVENRMFALSADVVYQVAFFVREENNISFYRFNREATLETLTSPMLHMTNLGYHAAHPRLNAILDVPENINFYVKKDFLGNKKKPNRYYAEIAMLDNKSLMAYIVNQDLDEVQKAVLNGSIDFRQYSGEKIPLGEGKSLDEHTMHYFSRLARKKDDGFVSLFEHVAREAFCVLLSELKPEYTRTI